MRVEIVETRCQRLPAMHILPHALSWACCGEQFPQSASHLMDSRPLRDCGCVGPAAAMTNCSKPRVPQPSAHTAVHTRQVQVPSTTLSHAAAAMGSRTCVQQPLQTDQKLGSSHPESAAAATGRSLLVANLRARMLAAQTHR